MERVRNYLRLAKPGVLAGNLITALAGYLLATHDYGFDWLVFLSMLVGMTLVVGGACALNNYYDRDIDSKMKRTKTRPSVSAGLSPVGMQLFAWGLFATGTLLLAVGTNWPTVVVGILGFVTYVWLYGRWTKRTSIHGTAVGAVSGALPIVGGYVAASGQVDAGALVVFAMMFLWQFPEFFSIAIYRRSEYKVAKIPVMPVVVGVHSTIVQIVIYTVLYVLSTLLLSVLGYTGWIYFAVMAVVGYKWVMIATEGLRTKDADAWARRMFKFSMITILVLCTMVSVGAYLP